MIKFCITIAMAVVLVANNAIAVQVKFPLPTKLESCSQSSLQKIVKTSREMALIDNRSLWGRWGLLYDLAENCTLTIHVAPNTDFTKNYQMKRRKESRHTRFIDAQWNLIDMKVDPGILFQISADSIMQSREIYFKEIEPIIADDSDYEKWKSTKLEKVKLAELEEQTKNEKRKLNSIISIPKPKYDKGDPVINVNFDGYMLKITNKSAEFVTISTISTYYNNKINTLSGLNLEISPESTPEKGIHHSELFSKEMEKNGEIRGRDLASAKEKITKFGFAIKYVVEGVEKKFYAVNDYNNSELLKNEH